MSASPIDFGLGLRPEHYEEIVANPGRVSWFEVLSENYMVAGGQPLQWLDRLRADYPMAMHGVSLSIGSIDPLDRRYLDDLKALMHRIEPMWVSDHLCFTGLRGINMHDLLPLPYTEEALDHVAERVRRVQDHLGRRLVLENVSSYITYAASELTEWDFIAALAERADCEILLDVNNVYVSAFNHEFDAYAFLRAMPARRVRQFHLAGHLHKGTHIIDTHDHAIIPDVWELYAEAIRLFPGVPTMIERDANIPPYVELLGELDVARKIAARVAGERTPQAAAG
ncbi:DUF692 domain-containing protein [Enhydrobacter sp.]|jgi:uncharacterized protein (UPF0276 family)|uniref:MNIO family bufferin maturase n=1 Tax=Enhydrobacter sp. TaxID=1894999 RepID=UPI002633AE6D|nr:DUF692 domain-containing protein [Enhydrobacter sp.]WIM09908.1 MAG: uncharacterized protein OJF58_000861 [Enhydrobacter sp.]